MSAPITVDMLIMPSDMVMYRENMGRTYVELKLVLVKATDQHMYAVTVYDMNWNVVEQHTYTGIDNAVKAYNIQKGRQA